LQSFAIKGEWNRMTISPDVYVKIIASASLPGNYPVRMMMTGGRKMNNTTRPVIAITMGDAAGVGPEVIVKALAGEELYGLCRPLVIGDGSVMQKALELCGSAARLNRLDGMSAALYRKGVIDLLDLHNLEADKVVFGRISAACGKAAVEYIYQAAGMARQGQIDAMVTAPINKEATRLGGYGELGHLELLAHYSGAGEYATMLVSGALRVVHLTTHYALKEALGFVTQPAILAKLKLIQTAFQSWGLESPRIGVAAINPHGGEGGILGKEEITEIGPAVKTAAGLGIEARGPFPADTVFLRAIGGEFDVVLALYHDQGHIPVKVFGFSKSYSVALGLPFIRTSVDHGTAFDIAGKGLAQSESMLEAIKAAVKLCRHEYFSQA
jgi:4-phospho-D-threonate 3-dehydrogenase / 4-phospho-D-erythronate 3-dehydrogenase